LRSRRSGLADISFRWQYWSNLMTLAELDWESTDEEGTSACRMAREKLHIFDANQQSVVTAYTLALGGMLLCRPGGRLRRSTCLNPGVKTISVDVGEDP
jgi:hypothetical protein